MVDRDRMCVEIDRVSVAPCLELKPVDSSAFGVRHWGFRTPVLPHSGPLAKGNLAIAVLPGETVLLGFGQFGGLALQRSHAFIGKQTLCQLSYSRRSIRCRGSRRAGMYHSAVPLVDTGNPISAGRSALAGVPGTVVLLAVLDAIAGRRGSQDLQRLVHRLAVLDGNISFTYAGRGPWRLAAVLTVRAGTSDSAVSALSGWQPRVSKGQDPAAPPS